MATAENVFPKDGNDPLYASEVNRFSKGVRIFECPLSGALFDTVGSATAEQNIGSFHINVGSLPNPTYLKFSGRTTMNARDNLRIQLSGASANQSILIGSGLGDFLLKGEALIGSPLNGMMYFLAEDNSLSNNSHGVTTTTRYSTSVVNNMYPGSDFVVNFSTNSSAAGTTVESMSMTTVGEWPS